MGKKRVIDTSFWEDDKVVEEFTPEDKYFMLYLLTNPHSTQLGIYQIPKKIIAFEIGYSKEAIETLIDRFENKYKMIKYNTETKEIAIKNYLKHSIVKGGKPVEDLLLKELSLVKDKKLISYIFNNINKNDVNESIINIMNKYKENDYINDNVYDNDNDNDNDVSCHDSYNDSYHDSLKEKENIYKYIEKKLGRTLTSIETSIIDSWKDYDIELIKSNCELALKCGNKSVRYIDTLIYEELHKNDNKIEMVDWLNKGV